MQKYIDIINLSIPVKYMITKYNPEFQSDLLSDFTSKEKCVPIQDFDKKGLLIFERKNNELMGYVLYGFSETSENEEFLTIDILCTGVKFRKRNLSTYLNLVLFLYALDNNVRYLACDTNDSSFRLLEKFGFSGREYLEKFDWLYSTFVDTRNPIFKKKVRNFFKKSKSPRIKWKTISQNEKKTPKKNRKMHSF